MMSVSRIVFNSIHDGDCGCLLGSVDVFIEDCLRVRNVRLFASAIKGYYLVFPSKQDLYSSIEKLNPDIQIKFSEVQGGTDADGKRLYDEYFFPVNSEYYKYLLEVITDAYNYCLPREKTSYHPRKEFNIGKKEGNIT